MDAVYIHIPFCYSLCKYCDFLSFEGSSEEEIQKYIESLKKEINIYKKSGLLEDGVTTIYFGGGTPSIIEPEKIKEILQLLPMKENCEITIEINPKTVTYEKLKGFYEIGINRLSIGMQTFNKEMLEVLGRAHTPQDAEKTYKDARNIGFKNISIDLMFSLPNEKIEDLDKDLDKLFELNPEHFSIYSLIWEEGTQLTKLLEKGILSETDNELEGDMYEKIIKRSREKGYIHYEISNFSKKGMESKHNMKYWENKEYLGLGLGASGYIRDERYKNIEELKMYSETVKNSDKPIKEIEIVSEEENEIYRIILGLRTLRKGIEAGVKFNKEIRLLVEDGYLKEEQGYYTLTEKGIFFANDVFEKFI